MGGGGKGGSTTVNKTEIPPEVLARYNAVNARAETVAQQPYQKYSNDPNAFVAGLTDTQTAGIQNTNAMAGAAQPYYKQATGLAQASAYDVNPNDLNVNQYMNPYTQNVVNATQAAMNQQQGQQLSQQQSEAIRGGAFGGERAGLQRSQLRGQQGLAQAQAISPLYQQNYNQALQTAQQQQGVNLGAQQANRANLQTVSQNLASLGTNAQQAGLAGAQAQMQAGQVQQQTEQAGKQAMYNQFMQEQGYPFQVAQFLANIATGTGALSGNQSTSTTTGGGGFFSDKRLKENVQKVGETNDGQPIYRYNYKGDKRTQIGLLAQDVEKEHPEAVGLAGGYKTVDYKKATDRAVRKADGGETTDAYSMSSPSQMLGRPSGLGALQLPQMRTEGIAVRSMTPAAEIEALRAPKATGFSPGTMEAARAERSSLASAPNNGIGSGPAYTADRMTELDKFLAANSSQGGLVGPQGGNFARGGYAAGGGGGPYGVQLDPIQQRQMMQGMQAQAPQRRDAMAEAKQWGDLATMGYAGYKNRPDFLRTAADVEARKQTEAASKVAELQKLAWAKENGIDVDALLARASGGAIGDREAYRGQGYVNAGSNPYGGGGGYLDDTLQTQQETPRPSLDVKGAPKPPPAKSGLGQLVEAGSAAQSAYKGGEKLLQGGKWAADKLGLGAPTAMSATSTGASAMPGVIDLTSGAGLAGAAPEAAAAAEGLAGAAGTGEALAGAAGAGEALAGGAAATEGALAGLAGGAEALGGGLMAAGSAALPFILPAAALFSLFAKDGGAIKSRDHYQARGFVPPEDGDAPVDPETVPADGGGDGESTRGDRITVVPKSMPEPVATAVSKAREAQAAPSKPFFPEITSAGVKDTLSSENFWVPALAGLGSMLASPNKTLAGAIGSGLVGGTGAYTEMQKQNALQTKQRFELAKDLFKGPVEGDDKKLYWRHVPSGKLIPQEEYERLYSDFVRGSAGTPRSTAPSSETPAVATARSVIAENPPEPAKAPTVPPASAAATAEAPAPAPVTPPVQPPAAAAPAEGEAALKNKAQIKNEMLANPQAWADAPPEGNPILLRQKAAKMEAEVAELRAKARRIATTMPENTTEGPRLTQEANQLDANRKEYIERSNQILNDAAELAYEDQKAQSAGRTAQAVGRTAVPTSPDVPLPQGMTVAQAENDPDYLGARIESNMKKYNELKARGALKEAGDYSAKVEKDRAQLQTVINTEYTTPEGTKYSVHPNAEVFNVTQPKPIPKDYKANVDPNTGIVVPKSIGEFIGYPETGGHPISPALIGKKAVIRGEGDKRLMASKAQSDELEKAFVGGAEKAEEGIATLLKFSTAAKVLESKGMNIPFAELSNIARGLGFETLADQIMTEKNTTAAFTALKTNVDQAISQVNNSFSRPTQAEFFVTEKKATPSIDMPVDAARSLTQTRLAGLMWQSAILSDWENAKRETGATNFAAFRDVWQKTHPKALFEDAADRVLGNFKGQALPKPDRFAEGVVYVVPKDPEKTGLGKALLNRGLRPGDLFVMNGVKHEDGDFGEPTRISPADAYKTHLRAPALTYGAR
jgi:hypothetical protein